MLFTSTAQAFKSNSSRSSVPGAYRQIGVTTSVEGANPHKLVSLLFDALQSEILAARGAIERGDIAEKGRAIGHAVRILQEGLIAPLDMQGGGAIAANLRDVYDYAVMRLTLANLRNDAKALIEAHHLIAPIQEAWAQIQSSVIPKGAAA
jgi:flagellar secretion chaperone FliS